MKKSCLIISASLIIFLAAGCSGKKPLDQPEEETEVQLELPDHIDFLEEKLLPSVVLAPNAGLNILGRDNQMHRMKSLSCGNAFFTVQVNGSLRPLNLFEEEDQNPEVYLRAVSDEVDFWVFENYVAVNAVPAIIVEAGDGFRFGQIVALSCEQDSEESTVFYFDKGQNKVCSKLIASEKVSTYSDDVEMAAIVEKLRVTARATPRNELFKRAEKLNPSPMMKRVLDAEKTEKLSYDYQEVLKSMPGSRYVVNVGELNTVDQTNDPFTN